MPLRRSAAICGLVTVLLASAGGPARPVHADDAQLTATRQSATYLLQRSVEVRRDGAHNPLLRSLRHLRDPLLEPLFAELAAAPHAALQIHGLLGLAEISSDQQLDLDRLPAIADAAVQAELVLAAIESDLLDAAAADRLLAMAELHVNARLLAAARLAKDGRLRDAPVLHEALDANRLATEGFAALLLHQLDDEQGTARLVALNRRQGGARDAVRAMLLNHTHRFRLHRAAAWAYAVATEPGVESRLGLLALQTALRFGDPRARAHWQEQFDSTRDPAQRVRLAMVALHTAPWQQPGLFTALADSDDELLAAVGRAGRAIAEGRADGDIAAQVGRLIERQHAMANGWALHYATSEARPAAAHDILLAVIDAYEQAPEQQRVRRLDEAVQATRALYELDRDAATGALRHRLTRDGVDPLLVRAMLMGLVRTQSAEPFRVVEGLTDWPDVAARRLALLLLARGGQALSASQMGDLAVLVQGGGGVPDALRIQAAWLWLQRTGQTQRVLDEVVDSL